LAVLDVIDLELRRDLGVLWARFILILDLPHVLDALFNHRLVDVVFYEGPV